MGGGTRGAMVGAYPLGARPGTPGHLFAQTESMRRRAYFAGPEPLVAHLLGMVSPMSGPI